jgi:hypothetical protein
MSQGQILSGCCEWSLHYYAHIFQFDLMDLGLNCQLNYENEDINYFPQLIKVKMLWTLEIKVLDLPTSNIFFM